VTKVTHLNYENKFFENKYEFDGMHDVYVLQSFYSRRIIYIEKYFKAKALLHHKEGLFLLHYGGVSKNRDRK